MVTILECKSGRSLRRFEQAAERIHRDDPFFVPPFPGAVTKLIGSKSLLRRHGEVHAFLALDNGKVVGRIAAILNRSHNDYYKDKVGFFGFFDFVDRIEVAQALLDVAKARLAERGCDTIRGPYNPTVNDECGLLVEGFESIPSVMMSYNPSYYPPLYRKLGLKVARDLGAFYLRADVEMPMRIQRIVERVKKRAGVDFRILNFSKLNEEIKILTYLYNHTLDRNWGFVPITEEDMTAAAKDLKEIVDPSMVMIAEKDGEPVGFSMTLPNINEFLWKVRSQPRWLRVLSFIWKLKTSHPREVRLAVLGVLPQYRSSGIAPVFYQETLKLAGYRYVGGELSWVEETNDDMISALRLMGATKYKSYRIYESPLVAVGGIQ